MAAQFIIQVGKTSEFKELIPDWIWHAASPGIPLFNFGLIDFGPVLFYFLIGIMMFFAFEKSLKKEGKGAYKRFFLRNAALTGLAMVHPFFMTVTAGGSFFQLWNPIMSVGFTGVILTPLLPLCRKSPWLRLGIGVAILTAYYLLADSIKFMIVNPDTTPRVYMEGGIGACFGFAGIVLVCGFLGDMMRKGILPYAITSAALVGAAMLLFNFVEKPHYLSYNVSYLVTGIAAINTVYFVLYLLDKLLAKFIKNRAIPLVSTMGRNLLLYLFITGVSALVFMFLPVQVGSWGAMIGILALGAAAYLLIAVPLAKKKVLFKL
jgi:hypothetical protein